MKIEVEIPEEWMINQLTEDCEICLSASLYDELPIREYQIANMASAFETCDAINKVIQYYGGVPVDLTKIKPHKPEGLSVDDVEILKKVLNENE